MDPRDELLWHQTRLLAASIRIASRRAMKHFEKLKTAEHQVLTTATARAVEQHSQHLEKLIDSTKRSCAEIRARKLLH